MLDELDVDTKLFKRRLLGTLLAQSYQVIFLKILEREKGRKCRGATKK